MSDAGRVGLEQSDDLEPSRRPRRLRRMSTRGRPVMALIALALTGCSSPAQDSGANPSPSAIDGTHLGIVTGKLLLVGGPAPGFRPTSGTVKLHGTSSSQAHADRRGHFSVAVDPGTYRVTGKSPAYGDGRYLCRAARPVTVAAVETRHVNVFCQLR